MKALVATLCVGLLMQAPAVAQQGKLALGEYIMERGWGVLRLETGPKGELMFSIEAVGGNDHVCGVDGEIRGGKSVLDGIDNKKCVVGFRPKGEGIEVTINSDIVCNYSFCGQGAFFDGVYLKVAPACTVDAVNTTRAAFKQRYDRKDYAAARDLLGPVLKQCARTLRRHDGSWMRNDLAITQYRLGDTAGCRQTLQPLEKEVRQSEDDLLSEFGLIPGQRYLSVLKATRTNLKLCSGTGRN